MHLYYYYCIYTISDAVMTVNRSLSVVISYVKDFLSWDFSEKPLAFNQDGPGWARMR